MLRSFPHYQQLDSMDCGPSCLRMIAKFYGRVYSIQNLREKAFITREGVSMLGISEAAEAIGFRTQGVRITVEELEKECPLPCILHWNQWHFVVCYKIKKGKFYIADPAAGLITYTREEFKRCWVSTKVDGQDTGTALLLEPGPEFYGMEDAELGRYRYTGQQPRFHNLDPYIAIGDLYRQAIRGLHTELDIAARKHEDQYRLDLRFPRQADAPAPAFLRYQDGGRYHAAHRRP